MPIVGGADGVLIYTQSEILRSALTVSLFLFMATIAWRAVSVRTRARSVSPVESADNSKGERLFILGVVMGIGYHICLISGWLEWAGSFFGVIRSIVTTFIIISCFLTGVTRAQGALRGVSWKIAVTAICALVVIAWSSLFLVNGLTYIIAFLFGYVIVARRIPWPGVAAVIVIGAILHAGKGEMREKYWIPGTNYGGISSVTQLPGLAAEWFGTGVQAIASGDVGQSALERASLLQVMLRVQSMTPDVIDYLNGETYALLPAILIPRFIESDKPASQIGMALLNVRYGVQTYEDADVTAIGWGLVAEAFANFGYAGIIGMGIALGIFCAVLAMWSANSEIVSFPTLWTIAAMMVLINIELDFIQLISTLVQSFVSVLVFTTLYRWLVIRQKAWTPSV
ncbi:MAG: hypothetical protein ACXWF2_00830 [Usitatibacter sp.]